MIHSCFITSHHAVPNTAYNYLAIKDFVILMASPSYQIGKSNDLSSSNTEYGKRSSPMVSSPTNYNSRLPSYRRPEDVTATYTGHITDYDANELHDLERPYHRPRDVMKGYSGHLPNSPLTRSKLPEEFEEQTVLEHTVSEVKKPEIFRTFGKGMETVERYETAKQDLFMRGQTQQMLMRIVQAKLSERVSSYAEQQIWLRNLFRNYEREGSDGLSESEFRQCLERMNIQFDDCQFLALFAYFDKDANGTIDFDEFARYAMVPNPKGGTAIIAKV